MAGRRLHLETHGFDAAAAHFAHLPKVVAKAEKRSLKRTAQWARTQGTRTMSQASNVTQKALKDSFRVHMRVEDGQANIWFGTNPIRAAYVGRLRQTKRGARAGRHKFAHGFVATMKSGHTGIFERQGKSRLPVVEQTVDIHFPESEFSRIANEANGRVMDQFHHDLEWYASKIRG